MKIVYIASRSLSEIGGIETYMKNLLPRLAGKGHEIILYTEGNKYQSYIYKGIQIINIPSTKSKFFNKIFIGIISTFHSLLFNKDVDIYHYNANAAALLSFMPRLFKKTVVYQGHGLEWKRAKWSPLMQKIIKGLDNFVIMSNKNITMVSDEQSNYIKENYKKNSITITSGVDIDDTVYDEDLLIKYKLKKDSFILYLGRLVPEKKADILIDAFIQADLSDLKLVIAGDDPNEKQYIDSLKNKGKEYSNIIFLGSVYGANKNVLLQCCKFFSIPSELEGLPITLLEAMSFGKLCLASNIEANIEALEDTGIYFEVNNTSELKETIKNIEDDFEKYNIMGIKAKQRISEKFTWNIIADKFDKYYQSVIKSPEKL